MYIEKEKEILEKLEENEYFVFGREQENLNMLI